MTTTVQADMDENWYSEFFRLGSMTPEDVEIMVPQNSPHTALRNTASHLSDCEIMTRLTKLGNLPPAVKTTLLELSDLT